MGRPGNIVYKTDLLSGFTALNIDNGTLVEVAGLTNTPSPGSGIWMLAASNTETRKDQVFGLNEGSELAWKYVNNALSYFSMGVTSGGNLKAVGADPDAWYDLNGMAGSLGWSITDGDYIIIKLVSGTLRFYKTSNMDSSRTELTTTQDFSGVGSNVITVKVYTYNSRPNSRIFYPQYKL